jgi:polysaccharide deacetylase family protein (PEP-CTERM system associated)
MTNVATRHSDQHPIVNALTVDVEDWFHANALAKAAPRSSWPRLDSRVSANTLRLLDLFGRYDVRGTFFVLGWVAEREPALVRSIAAAGHEIACHGYSHQLVFRQSVREFRDETARAKRTLEDITGERVRGYRASTYSITAKSLWALDVLAELEFDYDSSIFPIRHDVYGYPEADRWPGAISTPSGARIVEFPMSTADVIGVRLPVCGGGYFRLLPYAYTRFGLNRVNATHDRPFVFYLHPWEIDTEQPRMNVGLLSRMRHYTNLHRTEARLERLLREFSFSTMQQVLGKLELLPGRCAA